MMDKLPVEILATFCSYFSVEELERVLLKISKQWKAVAEAAISHRVFMLDRFISPEAREEVKTFFVPPDPTPLALLKMHESKNCVAQFKLTNFLYQRSSKLGELFDLMSYGGEMDMHDTIALLHDFFKFIPAHKLVMIVAEDKAYFIHEKDFFTVGKSLEPVVLGEFDSDRRIIREVLTSLYAYTIESSDAFRPFSHNHPSARVGLIDAYHENLVICPRNFRTPCFYNIAEVSHPTKTIILNLYRQVFLPFTIAALRIYRERLVVLFDTGFVGIWRVAPNPFAELILSTRKVTGDSTDARMFRIHNWMIIKSGPSAYDLVDGARDEVDLKQIPLLDLLSAVLPVIGSYKEVDEIRLTGNFLLVKARGGLIVVGQDEEDSDGEDTECEKILCVLKLKRSPTMTDFLSVDSFKRLVNLVESEFYIVQADSFLLIPPSIVPGRTGMDAKLKASLLMVVDDGDSSNVYDLLESHSLQGENCDPEHVPIQPGREPN